MMIYVVLLSAFIVVGFTVYQRAMRHSVALQVQAQEITRVMHAGERWRANVGWRTCAVRCSPQNGRSIGACPAK